MTTYCDVFVKTKNPHSWRPTHEWCKEEMYEKDGFWYCPKHGKYIDAIKTHPYGGYENLRAWNEA